MRPSNDHPHSESTVLTEVLTPKVLGHYSLGFGSSSGNASYSVDVPAGISYGAVIAVSSHSY